MAYLMHIHNMIVSYLLLNNHNLRNIDININANKIQSIS